MPPAELLPVDDSPPAELDPLGASQGVHAVDIPRELAPLRFDLGAPPSAATALHAPHATAERALAFLESELGLAEQPAGSNRNWITDWYFGWHAAWCAMTTSRALIEAGFGTPEQIDIAPLTTTSRKGWAYCPYVEADFKTAGRWHDTDPEPGDLVLFDWDGDEWSDHIGMLKRESSDGTLFVYEGNTDGGILALKHRSRTYVRGFARPPYATVVQTPVPIPAPQILQEDNMAVLVGVSNDRGIFVVGGNIIGSGKGKGKLAARRVGTPGEIERMVASGLVAKANNGVDLPEADFNRLCHVIA